MPTEKRVLCVEIGARPEDLYKAWLDGRTHGAMTGASASIDARVGGAHAAWDGYISGQLTELVPNERIAMTWRTTEFGDAPDSTLEVLFEPVDEESTLLTLVHDAIPEGQAEKYQQGWADFYFDPMLAYFGKRARASRPKKAKGKAASASDAPTEPLETASASPEPHAEAEPAKPKKANN